MATVEQVNGYLDKLISAGDVLGAFIPGLWDNLVFSLAKWARTDEIIQEWLATALEPDPNAFTAPPEVVIEALRRFENATGAAPGSKLQAIMALLQILAEIRKMFG